MKRLKFVRGGLFILLGFLIISCTTQKKRGELSSIGKLYHNTTAKYNGYFNANELLVAGFETLKDQQKDNFNQLLPVYEYVDPDNPKAIASDLDNAIEKVSIVVNLHRESKWTDDCYLIIGKSQFLKQDYEGAEQTFRYMINEFPPEKFEDPKRKDQDDNESKAREVKPKDMSKKQRKKAQKEISKERKKKAKSRTKFRKKYNDIVKKNIKRRKQGKDPLPLPKRENARKNPIEEVQTLANNTEEEDNQAQTDEAPKISEATAEPDTIISVSLFGDDEEVDEEGKPDGDFLKHRPAYQEAMLWLAKSLIERDNYDAALRYMDKLEKSKKTYQEIRYELASLRAYYHVRKKQYLESIPPLEDAIELATDKSRKARYTFILGQLQEMAGQYTDAYNSFELASKYANDYELVFSSKLAMIQNQWNSGKMTDESAINDLEKMLKDFKNVDYQDRIYFTMAVIALKSGDRAQGIAYLEAAIKNGKQSPVQKTEAYFKLANLYFETENYISAKNYFDSTLNVMPEADDRYPQVKLMSNNLTEIAQNLEVIELQDSLIKLSMLSEEEKKAFAYQVKEAQIEEQRAKIAQQANNQGQNNLRNNRSQLAARTVSNTNALREASTFFAYDDRALKRGKREFQNVWGNRSLEDNWRISDRQSTIFNGEGEINEEIVDAAITEEDLNSILKDVPKNDQDREIAKLKIKQAMFNLGKRYRDRLQDYEQSVKTLEELDQKYPGHNFESESWYYLYLVHGELGNTERQQYYKDKILQKYPSTTYAKVLNDPNYLATLKNEEQLLTQYYEETFDAFENGQYQIAIDRCENAKRKFGASNIYQPRFALLKAMCIGKTKGKEAYIDALKEVVGKYPNSDEQKRAREILRLLGGAVASLPGGEQGQEQKFQVEDSKLHYIIVYFNDDIKINEQKNAVSDYNQKFHKLDRLKITPLLLGNDPESRRPIIVVRRFKDKFAAMQYYQGVDRNRAAFLKDPDVDFQIVAVSQNNYRQILRSKSLDGYQSFFEDNYLK